MIGRIWKNLNSQYEAALSSYNMSGTHSSNFYEFCHRWKMYTTYESIWRPSLTSTLLWLQICQNKCASTAQEVQPQDYPQQAVHQQQGVKETRVRLLTY